MAKLFLDIGSHTGQTLWIAAKRFPFLDKYIGVEPIPELFLESKKSIPEYLKGKIDLYNIAIDYQSEPVKVVSMFQDIGQTRLGSSLFSDKVTSRKKEIKVNCEDIRTFLDRFKKDTIIMKLDVEGKEYDILKGMIKHNLFFNIKKLYIEWHWNKVLHMTEPMHIEVVKQLIALGYPLTGKSKNDEFYCGK